jgi:uncharacterized membrane protein
MASENRVQVQESARKVAELHVDAESGAPGQQRAIEQVAHGLGAPWSLAIVLAFALIWIGVNLALPQFGRRPFDPYPFFALQGLVTLSALVMTLLIFAAERNLVEFEQRRAKLVLQLTVLTEEKTAKIIELIEELRRDHPGIRDRHDEAAEKMQRPTDPQAALKALEQETRDLRKDRGIKE